MHLTTRFRVLGAATAAIGVFALPSIAQAAPLPNPADTTIVAPFSLGGVSIGQPGPEAEATWGDTVECKVIGGASTHQCEYGSSKKGTAALFYDAEPGVVLATIFAPYKDGAFSFKGPLMKYRTDDGLGLGTKLKTVHKKYPQAEYIKRRLVTIKQDGVEMTFFSSRGKLVSQVTIRNSSVR